MELFVSVLVLPLVCKATQKRWRINRIKFFQNIRVGMRKKQRSKENE